ncbi:TPA: type II secretion system protein, partial [Streptococcus agalactiae]|nr:type II secretion system protein [Streptococcus agalactiae]
MKNLLLKCKDKKVKAFTLLESLIVLSVVAFMTLVFSTSFNNIFRQVEET